MARALISTLTILCLGLLAAPGDAHAGPPFLTDDPDPTPTAHWEVYAPFSEAEGRGANFEGTSGIEFNYGLAPETQITLELPVAFRREGAKTRSGAGDVALSVKYRFFHDPDLGLSIAVFPGLTLPTGNSGMGTGRATGFLPVWFQKDAGPWTVFGGGGLAFIPGKGNRNSLTGALALSRDVSTGFTLGAEVQRAGSPLKGEPAGTSLGLAAIYRTATPVRVLGSLGPTFSDGGGPTEFHAYLALGLDF